LDAELCLALIVSRGVAGNRHAYLQLGGILRELAVVPDLAFEYDRAGFALIMPETELSAALDLLGGVRSRYERQGGTVTVSIGVSERGGRLIEGRRIFAEAKRAVQRAVRAGGNQLVGFRADPVKFRRVQSRTPTR
jgi:GGDEF domain-containing protein